MSSTVSLASAGVKQHVKIVVPEQQGSASQILEHGYEGGSYGGEYDHGLQDSGKASTGAELSSLAHSSAIQAKNAVQSQHTAGSQAAYGVKSTLATAALGVRTQFFIKNQFKPTVLKNPLKQKV